MRALVYTRQSLDRTGEGSAVSRQREDCDRLAELRGWTIVSHCTDNDTSAAGKRVRPGFEAVLKAVEEGHAEAIIAWSLDRLTRNRRDQIRLIETCEKRAVTVALVRGSDIDMSTPAGRLVADVLSGVARHEIDQKGDRQRRAQQQAAQLGKPAGGPRAFGYERDGMTVREDEARHLREAYRTLIQGGSLKSIAKRWNEAGVTTTRGNAWTHSTVRRTVQNARNAGLRSYRGEIVGPATWPAVVDPDTFEAVAALLSLPERRTTATTARKYILPGLALCGRCGSDMATGHTRHGKRVYVCRAGKCISRTAAPVDALVAGGEIEGERVRGLVVERLLRPDAIDLLTAPQTDDVATHRARAQAIRERLDDLATGLEEGILTLSAVRRSSDRLRAELAAAEAKIQTATHADVLSPLVSAVDVERAWHGYDLQQQRAVVDALMTVTLLGTKMGRNRFDADTVRIEWKG